MTNDRHTVQDLPILSELDSEDFGRDLSWAFDLFEREYVGPYQTSWGTPVFFTNEDLRAIESAKESTHQTLDSMSEYWRETAPDQCAGLLRAFGENSFSKRSPEHLPLKKLTSRRLTSRSSARFEGIARAAARTQIELVGDGSTIDFVSDFTKPMVARFWSNVLGLTDEESQLAIHYISDFQLSSLLAPTPEQIARASTAVDAYLDLMTEVLDRETRAGRHDILVELAQDFDVMGPAGKPESASTAFASGLLDGFHTLSVMNANVTLALLDSPDALSQVRQDQTLVSDAFQEGSRLHPAVILGQREAADDFSYKGIEIAGGTPLLTIVMFGNFDPTVWASPKEYRLDRDNRAKQTTFGGGEYICAGRNLVRMVVESLLKELTAPDVDIRRTGDVEWVPLSSIHESTSMPMSVRLT